MPLTLLFGFLQQNNNISRITYEKANKTEFLNKNLPGATINCLQQKHWKK